MMPAVPGPIAFQWRAEALEVFLVAGGGQRAERAAVERTLERDDAVTVVPAAFIDRLAHHLDHALVGFGARVAEEDAVGERMLHQPRGKQFRLRNAIQVGDVHYLGRLLGDRLGQMRMAVAERGGGNARPEIEESSPVHRPQPGAFAPLEREVGSSIVR